MTEFIRSNLKAFGKTTGDVKVPLKVDAQGRVKAHVTGVLDDITYIDFDTSATVTGQEGRMYWNDDDGTLNLGMPGGNVNLQIGQEQLLRAKNTEGSQIDNGQAVIISGASGQRAEVQLVNNTEITSDEVIAVATEDVLNNQNGYFTTFGLVRDIDTSAFTAGDELFLDSSDGNLTNTRPSFPNYIVHVAHCIYSHATEGIIFVHIHAEKGDDLANFFNGTFRETFDATVASDGATITLSLEQSGGGDLTMQFSDGLTVLDCTPAATVALTAGGDTAPKGNYVYIPKSTKVLTVDTSAWPTAEHIRVAYVLCQSAATTQTRDPLINQNWNDHLMGTNGQGHLSHITTKIRESVGATYSSGIAFTFTAGPAANIYLSTTAGVVDQMHPHTFAATDMSAGDDVHLVNAATAYTTISDLSSITADANGVTLSNKYFTVMFFGVANKTGEEDHVMALLPTGSYNVEADALSDVDNYTVTTIPSVYTHDSSTGFYICSATFKWSGGLTNLETIATTDFRGRNPDSISGGGAGTALTEFADTQFKLFDDGDSTKIIVFQADQITTGNTRTITMADRDLDLADPIFDTIDVVGAVNLNSGGGDNDTLAKGATDDNLFRVDAGLDKVLVGLSAGLTTSGKFAVNGSVAATGPLADPTAGGSTGRRFDLNPDTTTNYFGLGLGAVDGTKYPMWFQTGGVNGGGFEWYIGTSEKMRIDKDGKVGINTTAPDGTLSVNGSTVLNKNYGSTFDTEIRGDTQAAIFVDASADQVCIGGTSPSHLLTVLGSADFTKTTGGIDVDIATGDASITDLFLKNSVNDYALRNNASGIFHIRDDSNSVNLFTINSTEIVINESSANRDFRVEGNGESNLLFCDAGTDRVGIGTGSPGTLFHVYDAAGAVVRIENSGDQLDITVDAECDFQYTSDGVGNGIMDFQIFPGAGNNNLFRFGLDTGSTGTSGVVIFNRNGNNYQHYFASNDVDSYVNRQGGDFIVGSNSTAGSQKLQVSGGAGKTAGGTTWVSISDERLKITESIKSPLSNLLKLNGIKYTWNQTYQDNIAPKNENGDTVTNDETLYGFTAQNVESVFPEMVIESGGYKWTQLNLDGIIVEAIRELDTRLKALEA